MGANDKWHMFKNFMHNELDITRGDIQDWIKAAVKDEATRLVNKEFGEFNLKHMIREEINTNQHWRPGLHHDIKQEMADQLVKRLELSLTKEAE